MNHDITIIGAGMAGLACARRLLRAGYTPLVLDKGRGIGGRLASAQHLEETPETITARMLPMLAQAIGVKPQLAVYAAAHRWRYARTTSPLNTPFLCGEDETLHVGGDWCLGARVEAAWSSGTAIADAIIEQLGRL